MKRSDKEQLVTELRDKIKGANALYFTDFTGLNVKRMTELRRRFRRAGVEYVVIKNSLALRAVNESGLTGTRLRGPTGVVVAKDGIIAAKVLVDFAKENDQRPTMKGGLYDGSAIDETTLKKLATLPTREEALGQFVTALNSVLMMFALALEARKTQLDNPTDSAPAGDAAADSTPTDNAPAGDTRVADAPAADAPVADVPVAATPVADAPVAATPVAATPVAATPVADVPAADAPVADVPVADVPVADVPVADAPVADAPESDTPTENAPKDNA